VPVRERNNHYPALAGGVPKDFGVAEVLEAEVEDRVSRVLRPGVSPVAADGQVLGLLVRGGSGIDGDEAAGTPGPGVAAEAARVVSVLHCGAAVDVNAVFDPQRQRQLLPVDEVGADRVAPALVAAGI